MDWHDYAHSFSPKTRAGREVEAWHDCLAAGRQGSESDGAAQEQPRVGIYQRGKRTANLSHPGRGTVAQQG